MLKSKMVIWLLHGLNLFITTLGFQYIGIGLNLFKEKYLFFLTQFELAHSNIR